MKNVLFVLLAFSASVCAFADYNLDAKKGSIVCTDVDGSEYILNKARSEVRVRIAGDEGGPGYYRVIGRVVEGAVRRTHTPTLVEIIEFRPINKALYTGQITKFYVEGRLSTPQIAAQLGCSRTLIITTLKRQGLLRTKGAAQTDPLNYRNPLPPFGYRVVDGKLTLHPSEIKVCRLIVDLVDRQGMNRLAASRYLTRKGIKNRDGRTSWHNYTVSRIYARWKGKL